MRIAFLLLACVASVGCGLPSTSAPSSWVARHGGLHRDDHAAARLAQATAALPGIGGVRIRLIDSATPGAFAWPGGSIYVTRGLLDIATDAELTAAVAHELAHLDSRHAAALAPAHHGLAEEIRADRAAIELLRDAGCDAGALHTLLATLSASETLPKSVRTDLQARARIVADRLTDRTPADLASTSEQVVALGQR